MNTLMQKNRSFFWVSLLSVFIFVLSVKVSAQWTKTNYPDSVYRQVLAIATDGKNIYVSRIGEILFSTDYGDSWHHLDSGLANLRIDAMLFNNLGSFVGTDSGVFGSSPYIFKLDQEDSTWYRTDGGTPSNPITTFASSGSSILAGMYGYGTPEIIISVDSGFSWSPANSGLYSRNTRELKYSDSTYYQCSDHGIYVFDQVNHSWSLLGLQDWDVRGVVRSMGNLIAATNDWIFYSTDNGLNWIPSDTSDSQFLPYAIHLGGTPSVAFVSKYSVGAYFSTDGGSNWNYGGLDHTNEFVVLDQYIFTLRGSWSIYRAPISSFLVTSVDDHYYPSQIGLSYNYPNPFNPSTMIDFSIPQYSRVTLNIYDLTGRLVENLLSTTFPPGNYSINWNAQNHPSGVYFYRLQTDESVMTRIMTLTK